jgi:lipopolysaccharide/colanic/teichoic acid biosynthesis glycosyltransferase
MISEKLHTSILIADSAWIITALLIVGRAGPGTRLYLLTTNPNGAMASVPAVTLMVWSIVYCWLKLDGFQRGWSWPAMTSWLLIGVLLLGAAVSGVLLVLNPQALTSATLPMLLLFLAGFVSIRLLAHFMLETGWGRRTRKMIILGEGRLARELAAKINEHPEMRTQVVGFLSIGDHGDAGSEPRPSQVSTLQIIGLLKQKSVTDLVMVLSHSASREVASLVSLCRGAGICVSLVPEYYDLYVNLPRLLNVGGVPLLQLEQPTERQRLLACKPILDLLLVLACAVFALPALFVAALHLNSRRGRVLERETRCGRNGRHFRLYRLAVTPGDPANTWFMQLLERTSLTELPQLWNVLRGEMSLVGPRPETPDRIKHYSDWHRRRLSVKPGITGWAQVNGLRNGDSSDEKTRFDLYYILHWSPLLDCVVLLQTGWTLLSRICIPILGHIRESGSWTRHWAKFYSLPETHADSAQSSAD